MYPLNGQMKPLEAGILDLGENREEGLNREMGSIKGQAYTGILLDLCKQEK